MRARRRRSARKTGTTAGKKLRRRTPPERRRTDSGRRRAGEKATSGDIDSVATFVDRKSLFLVAAVMPDKTAGALHTAALTAYIGTVPRRMRHTLTVDNGKEFAGFKDIERALDIDIYFA